MRLIAAIVASLALACAAGVDSQESRDGSAAGEPPVAFTGVNVIPMDSDRVLRDQTVIVRGERIVSVSPSATTDLPRGATIIEARGKWLIPGLAEMHGHIPPPTAPQQSIDDTLFLYAANGITTVRGMLGHPGQLELREAANRGEILSPTLYLAGPSFSGGSISSPEQAVERVKEQKAEGWDLLKVHPGLTREEFDAMARTANELGIRYGGHVPADVGLVHAIDMNQETFDHLDGYVEYLGGADPIDPGMLAAIVAKTRKAGAWVVPTMALWETLYGTADLDELRSYPELKYVPAQAVEQWTRQFNERTSSPQFNLETSKKIIDNRMKVLKALNDGGALILMGTDAPQQFSVPGFSLHRELERMSGAGMSNYEILKSGTYNVGQYFKHKDDFGTIETGKRADLVLLSANPLADITNVSKIDGVMVRGRWLPKREIETRLAEIESRHRR